MKVEVPTIEIVRSRRYLPKAAMKAAYSVSVCGLALSKRDEAQRVENGPALWGRPASSRVFLIVQIMDPER